MVGVLVPGMEIRTARLDELPRISELDRRVWRNLAPSPEEVRRRFALFPQGFLVAVAGMEILGFCCGLLTNEDASRSSVNEAFPPRHVPRGAYLFLFALTVDPVFRRKGIAGALLDAELDLARKLECRSVQLIANAFSQPLFEGRGFLAVSSGVSLFAGCRDLMPEPVLMEKMLARQPAEADRRSV